MKAYGLLITMLVVVFLVFAATVKSSAQRYRGSTYMAYDTNTNHRYIAEVKLTDKYNYILEVRDVLNELPLGSLVIDLKLYFINGKTMALRNEPNLKNNALFVLTSKQSKLLRKVPVSSCEYYFKYNNETYVEKQRLILK